jgi:hypothetical protein
MVHRLSGWHEFVDEIEQSLIKRPTHTEPRCVCLARLGVATSDAAFVSYIEFCIDDRPTGGPDESLTPEWAVVALERRGDGHGLAQANALWDRFIHSQRSLMTRMPYYRDRPASLEAMLQGWNDRLAGTRSNFSAIMALFEGGLRQVQSSLASAASARHCRQPRRRRSRMKTMPELDREQRFRAKSRSGIASNRGDRRYCRLAL